MAGKPFVRPEGNQQAPAAVTARELLADEYEPPAPEPMEWDEDRVGPVLRGVGFVVHQLDPVAGTPFAPDLWKMTEADLDAIAAPLARIANRYQPARHLAGKADEVALGVAVYPYIRQNLLDRSQALAMRQQSAAADRHAPPPGYVAAAPLPEPAATGEPEPRSVGEALHLAGPRLVYADAAAVPDDVAPAGARGDISGDVFDRPPPPAGIGSFGGVLPDDPPPAE